MDFLWTTYITASLLILAAQQTQSREIEVDMLVSTQPAGSPKKRIKINLDIGDGDVNLNEIRERVQAIIQQTNDNRCAVTTVTSNDVTSTSDVTSTPDITTTTEKVPSTMPVETTDVIPTTENVVTNTPDIITTTEKVTSTTLVKTTDVTPTTENVVTNTPDIITATEKVTSATLGKTTDVIPTTENVVTSTPDITTPTEKATSTTLVKTTDVTPTTENVVTNTPDIITATEKATSTTLVKTTDVTPTTENVVTNTPDIITTTEKVTSATLGKTTDVIPTTENVVTNTPDIITATEKVTSATLGKTTDVIPTTENVVTNTPDIITATEKVTSATLGKTTDVIPTTENVVTSTPDITTPTEKVPSTTPESLIEQTIIMDNGYKYHLLKTSGFCHGKVTCEKLNGTLAVHAVNNYTVMEKITTNIRTQYNANQMWLKEIFVGFTDSKEDGNFTADDGTVVKEPEGRTPWNIHEPNNAVNGEDCVYVITTGSPRLNDVNCGKGIFGLCECNSTISGGISDIVISGFTYFLTNGEKNAANAEAYCKEMNATLAIRAVNDYEIMRDVLLRINTTENLYVGFNDNEIETEFMAIDGTPLMETMGGTQWNFGQPTDIVDKTECVSVQLYKSPKLRVSDCNETSFALCEIPN